MRNTLETKLGIFFALTLIVAVIILEMVGVADFFKPGYKVYADFKTVQELNRYRKELAATLGPKPEYQGA